MSFVWFGVCCGMLSWMGGGEGPAPMRVTRSDEGYPVKYSKAVAVGMFRSNGLGCVDGEIQITKPHLHVEAKLPRPLKSSQTSSRFGGDERRGTKNSCPSGGRHQAPTQNMSEFVWNGDRKMVKSFV